MSSFGPSNILIIIWGIFLLPTETNDRRISLKTPTILFKRTNEQAGLRSTDKFSAFTRCVVDACGALGSGNEILRWPEFVALPVNVDLAVQQVAQNLSASGGLTL